jgi:hypothetical protein
MMKIQNRLNGKVIHSGNFDSMKELVLDAIEKGANLRGAYLDGANLWGANLGGANLGGANLEGANLRDANLWGANLDGANLRGVNLDGANLWGANLGGANLGGANLRDADLWGANLWGAYLRGANLRGAYLDGANLGGANLRDANLDGANLCNCAGNRDQIKSIFISEKYSITYTSEYLQIGCESHLITDWWKFDDDRIKAMDGDKALNFWAESKSFIKKAIKLFPATPTNHEESKN